MQEIQVRSLGQEDLLEEEMATHSSILAWKIPRIQKSALSIKKHVDFRGSGRDTAVISEIFKHFWLQLFSFGFFLVVTV